MFLPIPTKVLGVDAVKLGRRPRFGMDAVRNAGDGYFLNGNSRPDILPKASTHLAVKLAHAIGVAAYAERENGHTERVGNVDHRLPESEQIVETDPEIFRISGEMPNHHFAWKSVVSGRHGSVRGKNVGRGNHLEGCVIIQALILDILADPFE